MKYLKIIIILFVIWGILYFGYKRFSTSNVRMEKAEYSSNYENIYPDNCFIKFDNKKYLIQNIYKYKNKTLNEFWFVGSEGFAIQKINNFSEVENDNNLKPFAHLTYSQNEKTLKFNSNNYLISERRNDTIISKINENRIILFINE